VGPLIHAGFPPAGPIRVTHSGDGNRDLETNGAR
jgi:hypothetical protein